MKNVKAKVEVPDFRVWCGECCIRIAPYEERLIVTGKTYHQNCYSKPASKAASAKSDTATRKK